MPARTSSGSKLQSIVWIFSPGHTGVLGNERADVLAGSAEIRGTLIMDPPAVRSCCCARDADCHQNGSFDVPTSC